MPKNHDYDIPITRPLPFEPVLENNFDVVLKIPIYWGPNQTGNGYTEYKPPDALAWRHLEILNIPQVIRFLVAAPIEYDSDDFNDENPTDVTWICIPGDGRRTCTSDDEQGCISFIPPFDYEVFVLAPGEFPPNCE